LSCDTLVANGRNVKCLETKNVKQKNLRAWRLKWIDIVHKNPIPTLDRTLLPLDHTPTLQKCLEKCRLLIVQCVSIIVYLRTVAVTKLLRIRRFFIR
jgi:hypothetical protein